MKPKRCRVCHQLFTPTRAIQPVCDNFECKVTYATRAAEKARAARARNVKREARNCKDKLKSRAQWMKEAQAAFNAWVRARDADLPCISCGRYHQGQWHAGHYRTVGGNPELRFEPLNCWKQCQPCNTHLHGNLINYRINLIARIGLERVEWLESSHEPKKYTVDDLMSLKAIYKAKLKAIRR